MAHSKWSVVGVERTRICRVAVEIRETIDGRLEIKGHGAGADVAEFIDLVSQLRSFGSKTGLSPEKLAELIGEIE